MAKIIELKIKEPKKIYQELAAALSPYREELTGSVLFIVEGRKKEPIIGLRYPGRKLRKRELRTIRANSVLWANLYDFEVVPFEKGKEVGTQKFTYQEILKDFQENKRDSKEFWVILKELYKKNTITKKPPKLAGIDPLFYLLVLKWIWIQEDFNYRFSWEDVNSPIRYVLETRTAAKSIGRARFFAALTLIKNNFTIKQIKQINPVLLD